MIDRIRMIECVIKALEDATNYSATCIDCSKCPYKDVENCFLTIVIDNVIENVIQNYHLVNKGENDGH